MSSGLSAVKSRSLRDCSLLVFICAIIYLPLLGTPVWDGNEPMRVIAAKEMLKTGNWIMPMLNGRPYFTKPPLMNWLIAASVGLFGVVNEWTSRFPSVLMMLMTSISVYFFTKKWLVREARLFAGVMLLSMPGLMEIGRTAEIDSLQVWITSLVLLVWINGYYSQWLPAVLWGLSLSLVGIGFLSKGPQIISYFYMTVVPYLLIRKRISFIFSWAHVFGVILLLLILIGYLLSILHWTTLDNYLKVWIGESMRRTESDNFLRYLNQLILYPFELILALMPCFLFLVPLFLYKDLREEAKKLFKNEIFVFSLVVVFANLPLYWLLPNMRHRYFLPAFPFAALVIASIFEIYLGKIQVSAELNDYFRKFTKAFTIAVILSAIAVIPAVMFLHLNFSVLLLTCIAGILLLGLVVFATPRFIRLSKVAVYMAFVTGLLFLIYTDLNIMTSNKKQENSNRNVAREIDRMLPISVDKIYVIGYRQCLEVTCYLDRDVYQLDTFGALKQLKEKGGKAYVLYSPHFLESTSAEDRSTFLQEMHAVKIYSKKYKFRHGVRNIILGEVS